MNPVYNKFSIGPSVLLVILLPGLFLSDIAYGFINTAGVDLAVTPGQIIRGGVLLLSIVYLINNKSLIRGKLGFFLIIISSLMALSAISSSHFPGYLAYDIGAGIKVLYGPFVVVLFVVIYRRFPVDIDAVLYFTGIIFYVIGLSLLIMNIMGVGEYTYGDYSAGFKGVFKAQNDIGLSASIALSAAVYNVVTRPRWVSISLLILSMIGMVGLGTRTSMATLVIVPLAVSLVLVFGHSRTWKGFRKSILIGAVLPAVVVTGGYLSTKAYYSAVEYTYQQSKLDRTAEGEIYRKMLLEVGLGYVGDRHWINDVIGEGAYTYRYGLYQNFPVYLDDEVRIVEMDWFDLYGQYGIVFTVLLYGFYLRYLCGAIAGFLRTRLPQYGVICVMLGIYLSHSAIAGHALSSPIVSTQIAALLAFLYQFKKIEYTQSQKGC